MNKKLIALLLAAVFTVICAFAPVSALFGTAFVTPDGYYDHDYQALVAFLETEDENGVKNGLKLSLDYDPADPSTWQISVLYGEDDDQWEGTAGVSWYFNGVTKYVNWVDLSRLDMCGELDLSGCPKLSSVNVSEGRLTMLDLTDCPQLRELDCGCNELTSLRLGGCSELLSLRCGINKLTSLDVSGCTKLIDIDTYANSLTEIDLSSNPELFLDRVCAEGGGRIAVSASRDHTALFANGSAASIFSGWYNEAGSLICGESEIEGYAEWDDEWEQMIVPDPITATGEKVWIARFVPVNELNCSEYELAQLRAFFEQTDENGIKNGEKLDPAYDPDDISTWTSVPENALDYDEAYGVIWCNFGGEAFVHELILDDMDLVGELDIHGFAQITNVDCCFNRISGADVSDCPDLLFVDVRQNRLSKLEVGGCSSLYYLACSSNELTALDLSGNTALELFYSDDNRFAELDFSADPLISIDKVSAQGNGYVSYEQNFDTAYLRAVPAEGCCFIGWYDPNGSLITEDAVFGGERIWDDEAGEYVSGTPIEDIGISVWQARFVDENVLLPNSFEAGRLRSFFEQADENGVKNGEKLNPDYSPLDPSTWSFVPENGGQGDIKGVEWIGCGLEKYVYKLNIDGLDMVGTLDLSGFEKLSEVFCSNGRLSGLDVSGCTGLSMLFCDNNELAALSLSGCTELDLLFCGANRIGELDVSDCLFIQIIDCSGNLLTGLDVSGKDSLVDLTCCDNAITELDLNGVFWLRSLCCQNNRLSELDVSDCPLEYLDCSNNLLTSLDMGENSSIQTLNCCDNQMTEIDLSGTPLFVDRVSSEGHGFVGYYRVTGYANIDVYVAAVPEPGYRFTGWYNEAGDLIAYPIVFGGEEQLTWSDPDEDGWSYVIGRIPDPITQTGERVWIARFEEYTVLPGDADGNGFVDTTDALLVLRCALGITGNADQLIISCDMDFNGAIDTVDALIILRMALGII